MNERVIFHIDVNNAYLSWEAVYRLSHGASVDLRTIPAIVGGNPETRHGIVLAKSMAAKKYGIQTGESISDALKKCPVIKIVPPKYSRYLMASNAMVEIIKRYSEAVERYSIDECFVDFTDTETLFGDPLKVANHIRCEIEKELGFTVSVGISSNKLLAKMASELKKPNAVSTLFPEEIPFKLWPLPIGELFMVGRATYKKLVEMGILTIGDLARLDPKFLTSKFKSYGNLLWQYANGYDYSQVHLGSKVLEKSIGNSTTIGYDIVMAYEAEMVLLSLCESVGSRLREKGYKSKVISIHIKNHLFETHSKQCTLKKPIDGTLALYDIAKQLFNLLWDGEPIRHLGVCASALEIETITQLDFLTSPQAEKLGKLDETLDFLRKKYDKNILVRGCFVNSGFAPIVGGVGDDDYIMMGSVL